MLTRLMCSPRTVPAVADFDRLFDAMLSGFPAVGSPAAPSRPFPALNVWESGENVFIEAELPGVALEQVDITIQGDELTISGQRAWQTPEGATVLRRERPAAAFTRTIRLPFEIEQDKVDASMKDGVLTITLPKAPEARARKIQVRAGSAS